MLELDFKGVGETLLEFLRTSQFGQLVLNVDWLGVTAALEVKQALGLVQHKPWE